MRPARSQPFVEPPEAVTLLCSNTPLDPSTISTPSHPFHIAFPLALLSHPPVLSSSLCPCIRAVASPPSSLSSCLPCALAACTCGIIEGDIAFDTRATELCARAAQIAISDPSSSTFDPDLPLRLAQLLWRFAPGHATAFSIMSSRCSSQPAASSCQLSLLVRSAAAADGCCGTAAALASKAFALDKGPRPLKLFARAHFYSVLSIKEAFDSDVNLLENSRADYAAELSHALTNAYLASSRSRCPARARLAAQRLFWPCCSPTAGISSAPAPPRFLLPRQPLRCRR